jgi:hypothetical protein
VIREDLYWEGYERAKMVARDAQRKADKQREDAEAAAAGAHAPAEGEHADWQVRLVVGAAQHAASSAGFQCRVSSP